MQATEWQWSVNRQCTIPPCMTLTTCTSLLDFMNHLGGSPPNSLYKATRSILATMINLGVWTCRPRVCMDTQATFTTRNPGASTPPPSRFQRKMFTQVQPHPSLLRRQRKKAAGTRSGDSARSAAAEEPMQRSTRAASMPDGELCVRACVHVRVCMRA